MVNDPVEPRCGHCCVAEDTTLGVLAGVSAIQDNLTAAVDAAREQAMLVGNHGIMITQHDFGSFTVALSPDVPYGQTREQRRFGNTAVQGH